jgi:hypothetical protein
MKDRLAEDRVSALGYLLESGRMRRFARQPGTLGYFTAVSKSNCTRGTYCTWTGTFASLNPFVVFPRHGATRWHEDVGFLAIAAIILVPWLYLVVARRMWRSRWRAVLALPARAGG